jgi:hypothetical protein
VGFFVEDDSFARAVPIHTTQHTHAGFRSFHLYLFLCRETTRSPETFVKTRTEGNSNPMKTFFAPLSSLLVLLTQSIYKE